MMASVSLVKSAGGLVWRTGGALCVPAGHKVFCEEEGVSDRVSLLWILMLVCRDSCGLGGLRTMAQSSVGLPRPGACGPEKS